MQINDGRIGSDDDLAVFEAAVKSLSQAPELLPSMDANRDRRITCREVTATIPGLPGCVFTDPDDIPYDHGFLDIHGFLPGDINFDGRVNDSDVNPLRENIGEAGLYVEGEFNFSGFVASTDTGVFRARNGQSSSHRVISTGGSLKLRRNAVIDEDAIAFKAINQSGRSSINGTKYPFTAATAPLPAEFTVRPGRENIRVRSGESLVLPPGSYKNLKVDEFAELTLQSGACIFKIITVEQDSVVNLDGNLGPLMVQVQKNLELKDRVTIAAGGLQPGNRRAVSNRW